MSVLLGIVVGIVLGLTGAGGAVLAVPLLMLGLGWTLPEAAPVALLAVCAAATFGTIVAWDVAHIRYRAAMLMAGVGLLTAPLGLKAGRALPADILARVFALVLLIAAIRMIWQARHQPAQTPEIRTTAAGDEPSSGGPICKFNAATGHLIWTRSCTALLSGIGAVTGFLSGLLGVAGGFVIVPALRSGSTLSMHSAVATSLMTVALTSAGTVSASLMLHGPLPWPVAVPFVAGALIGMFAGRKLAPRIAGPSLQQSFAACMLVVAFVIFVRTVI